MTTTLRIAEVARRSGFSPPTLRYYEDIGLLPAADRSDNGYRVYDQDTLERLGFIARTKRLGCSLDEITDLVRAWETGHCVSVQRRLQRLVGAKIADAQSRIAELTALTADLQRVAASLGAHTPDGPCDDRCGCTTDTTDTTAATDISAAADSAGVGGGTGTGAAAVPLVLSTKPVGSAGASDDPPIACTLAAGDMAGRLDDWNAALAGVVARRPLEGGVRLEFGADADVTEMARLATAEQSCCQFFAFALVVDQRGIALEVRAPADGQDVLTAVFGAAPLS